MYTPTEIKDLIPTMKNIADAEIQQYIYIAENLYLKHWIGDLYFEVESRNPRPLWAKKLDMVIVELVNAISIRHNVKPVRYGAVNKKDNNSNPIDDATSLRLALLHRTEARNLCRYWFAEIKKNNTVSDKIKRMIPSRLGKDAGVLGEFRI